jgi:hypothetical protein
MARLSASAEALAALAARLRAGVEAIELRPEIEAALDGIVAERRNAPASPCSRVRSCASPPISSSTPNARRAGASTTQ